MNIKCKQTKFQINTKHVTQIGTILRRNDNYIYFDHIIIIQLDKRIFMALFKKIFLFYYKQCEKTYRVQLIEKNKSNNLFKYKQGFNNSF